jgi:hypothetical protein
MRASSALPRQSTCSTDVVKLGAAWGNCNESTCVSSWRKVYAVKVMAETLLTSLSDQLLNINIQQVAQSGLNGPRFYLPVSRS